MAGAVYIDGMQKITTRDVPHVKAEFGSDIWLIGKLPEGDYSCHVQHLTYRDGYGGMVVEFLMLDGTIESFKGPFHETPEEYNIESLERQTGITDLRNRAMRIEVGTNIQNALHPKDETTEIVFSDEFSIIPLAERLKPEFEKHQITVWGRHMGRYYRPFDKDLKDIFDGFRRESKS